MKKLFAAPTQEGMMGASLFSLGCAPYLVNSTTYAPVGLFDTLLGCREGCVTVEENTVKISFVPEPINTVQIPSPFVEHVSLEDTARAAGFPLTAPEAVSDNPLKHIQSMGNEMIQVSYVRVTARSVSARGPEVRISAAITMFMSRLPLPPWTKWSSS